MRETDFTRGELDDQWPDPEEWLATGRALLDMPIAPHGKLLRNATRRDLEESAQYDEQRARMLSERAARFERLAEVTAESVDPGCPNCR